MSLLSCLASFATHLLSNSCHRLLFSGPKERQLARLNCLPALRYNATTTPVTSQLHDVLAILLKHQPPPPTPRGVDNGDDNEEDTCAPCCCFSCFFRSPSLFCSRGRQDAAVVLSRTSCTVNGRDGVIR